MLVKHLILRWALSTSVGDCVVLFSASKQTHGASVVCVPERVSVASGSMAEVPGHSCLESNLWPFDHKSSALPLSYPCSPNELVISWFHCTSLFKVLKIVLNSHCVRLKIVFKQSLYQTLSVLNPVWIFWQLKLKQKHHNITELTVETLAVAVLACACFFCLFWFHTHLFLSFVWNAKQTWLILYFVCLLVWYLTGLFVDAQLSVKLVEFVKRRFLWA